MAAMTHLFHLLLGYSLTAVHGLIILTFVLGSTSILLNLKLMLINSKKCHDIAVLNICTGFSCVLFGTGLMVDYNDFRAGIPNKDGYSLTFSWDLMSTCTLISFVLYLLSLKTLALCVVEQAKVSAIYITKNESQSLAPLLSLSGHVPAGGWFSAAIIYTTLEVTYRFVCAGMGTGPELYGDVKLVQDERNIVDALITLIIPCCIPAVLGLKLALQAQAPDFNVKSAHVITAMSTVSILICVLSFLFNVTWFGYQIYYPMESFVCGLISQNIFAAAMPLVNYYYHGFAGYRPINTHEQ